MGCGLVRDVIFMSRDSSFMFEFSGRSDVIVEDALGLGIWNSCGVMIPVFARDARNTFDVRALGGVDGF